MDIKQVGYLFPEKEIIDWQNGKELPKELLESEICFLKFDSKSNRIETSKNGSIDYSFSKKCFDGISDDIKSMENNTLLDRTRNSVKILLYKKDEKVVIQFTCMYITYENYLFAIQQANNYGL